MIIINDFTEELNCVDACINKNSILLEVANSYFLNYKGGTFLKMSEKNINEIPVEEEERCEIVQTFLSEKRINRKLVYASILTIIATFLGIYHLVSSVAGEADAMSYRSIDLALLGIAIILMYPLKNRSWKDPLKWTMVIDMGMIIFLLLMAFNIIIDPVSFAFRESQPLLRDYILGITLVLIVMELSRRVLGWPLVFVQLFFILHTLFGSHFPGIFQTPPIRWQSLISHLYVRGSAGIFGIPMGCLSSYIYIFVLFASVLAATGAGKFLINLAYSLTGHQIGGPAKASVVSSALMGTISGSAVANVVTTGSFTIPLMKRVGYAPSFAGAIEALASSGGQIMPPIMGAAAFIMADFLGLPYGKIVIAAVIPAILYFLAIFITVHLRAQIIGIKPLNKSELPKLGLVMKSGGYFLVPLFTIIVLLVYGYSAQRSAFIAIFLTIILSLLNKKDGLTKDKILEIFTSSMKANFTVLCAVASAGIIIGSLELSGLGLRLASVLVSWGGEQKFVILLITMGISLILGMGMPTAAVYVTVATLVAPILVNLGFLPIAAHMFVFYFGVIALITPPVSISAYAAAGVANSDPVQTGFSAFRIGISAYIIPFYFVFNPVLLAQGELHTVLWSLFTAGLGIFALSVSSEGYLFRKLPLLLRILLLFTSFMLIDPKFLTDLIGLACVLFIIFFQKLHKNLKLEKKEAI